MALFKRAQVSVLLKEPDRARRIALAREKADADDPALIERERLFRSSRSFQLRQSRCKTSEAGSAGSLKPAAGGSKKLCGLTGTRAKPGATRGSML
jgi:hypothetical protein